MFKDTISTLLFIAGFCLLVPLVPWALWSQGPQTEGSLLLLMVSLPLYVWASGYFYMRGFNATETGVQRLYLRLQGFLAERPTPSVDKMWILQPVKIQAEVQTRAKR